MGEDEANKVKESQTGGLLFMFQNGFVLIHLLQFSILVVFFFYYLNH